MPIPNLLGLAEEREQRRRLHQKVAEALTVDILTGTVAVGQALPADPILSSRYGVSRTVIREAIQALVARGLVDVRQGAGTYVNHPDRWQLMDQELLAVLARTDSLALVIDDLTDIRRIFESEAAALASERATKEDIAALQSVLNEMKSPGISAEDYCRLDIAFHGLINEASHNRILRGFKSQIEGLLQILMSIRQSTATNNDRLVSAAMHELVLKGIAERQPDRARAAMLAHIQTTERVVRAHFKRKSSTAENAGGESDGPI